MVAEFLMPTLADFFALLFESKTTLELPLTLAAEFGLV